MEEMKRKCELCNGEAKVYCPSDNAFLCYICDSKVHCANFLVARHVRSFICSFCGNLDGNRFSGAGVPPIPTAVFCRNCTPTAAVKNDSDGDSLSSCSSCVSSTGEAVDEVETTSFSKRKEKMISIDGKRREKPTIVADLKVEGILVNWCRRMNGVIEEREIGAVVNMAVPLLTLNRITSLPFPVSLATSFWVGVRIVICRRRGGVGRAQSAHGYSSLTCKDLKTVEQISGVPAKLILATEAKLARAFKRKQSRDDHSEGWAEC